MSLMKSKKRPQVKKTRRPELTKAKMTIMEPAVEVFTMANVGGDSNLKACAERLRDMSSNQRREIRQSIQRLDYLIDDVCLELLAKRSRNE